MGSYPVISLIILNRNGRKFLEALISSIFKQTYTRYEVIFVDTGSTDGSLQYLNGRSDRITTVICAENSFSAGNNAGIRLAKGKYVLVLNNDVELDENFLSRLVEAAERSLPAVGMWATKILNFYRRDVIDSTGLLIYPDGICRGRGRMQRDSGQFDKSLEVFFPSGCAGMYRKDMLDTIGLFDEDYQFFLEDSDLGFRARLGGWTCLYVPDAKLYHRYSATVGKYSARKAFLVERNRVWFAAKLFPLPLLLRSPLYTLQRYCYQLYGVFARKGSAAKLAGESSGVRLVMIVCSAWISAIVSLPRIVAKRKAVRKYTVVGSKEIVSWFRRFGIPVKELSLTE